ncbi:Asphd2 [Symbiodinium sp. CCMP2592]|nr:Asphd2 [Symbiodinium sp. CCMP2592]
MTGSCHSNGERLVARLRELLAETPDIGYRAVHAALQAEETFKDVSLKTVQNALRDMKCGQDGYKAAMAAEAPPSVTPDEKEVHISRGDISQRFGMVLDEDVSYKGGHHIRRIVEGGVVDEWNKKNETQAIAAGDILLSVNGQSSLSSMVGELKEKTLCVLRIRTSAGKGDEGLREDDSEAKKEEAEWERRRARVTAALVPGLKKIIDHEFGTGAGERIERVETMYSRIGRNDVYKEEHALGPRLAPGYIHGLSPVSPFHDVKDHPWCAQLKKQWKAIRQELRQNLDPVLWTGGAYEKSNEAYGKDWKIMGVLTEDRWQDEKRFQVTTGALQALKGIKPFEAFFAKMPPRTKIAPHSDNLNYILTSHLALELEEGKCSITVGKQEQYWKEGEMLILDTTFIHSTKNESERPRYVLVLRFWHPGLTEEERRAIHVSHAILARAAK